MTIDIICPLYNAERYIMDLNKNILKQVDVKINKVIYILTKSKDNSEKILNENNCDYDVIEPITFSHSLTREKYAMQSNADILVFITQDIQIQGDKWLYNLTKSIKLNECEACYSKQLCNNNTIEKYIREKNYPGESFVVTSENIGKLGLKTFFFSDASSAIRKEIFVKLNGYDGKEFPTNEDMYIAYKLITKGYKIKYCADSEVIHSHKFTLKQLYKRYYDTGIFFRQNKYLEKYKVNNAGEELAKYALRRAIQEKNVKVLFDFIPNMLARFIGMKMGKSRRN